MPMGFIQSELDLKLLVLYIMSRVAGPVTFLQLLELALCDEGVDYFSLTEAVGHMVETGQLQRDEEQHYSITDKGRRNSEICESSLPMSVRLLTDRNVAAYNQMLLRKEQVRAQVTPRENGTYTVTLHFSDDVDELLHLELMAATRDLAQGLADRFQKNPEQFYTRLMDTLFPKE